MISIVAILLAAALPPQKPAPSTICSDGRAALRDLPAVDRKRSADLYYGAVDGHPHDLLYLCPKLKDELPEGYSLATSDARRRAATHAPIAGYNPRPAYIYVIDAPEFSVDLKSAFLHFEYSCTGLCGGAFEARYHLTSDGWHRQGDIRPLYVS